MSSQEVVDREKLDQLSSKILDRTGKKVSHRELIELCLNFTEQKLEEFLANISQSNRKWTTEEVKKLEKDYILNFGEGSENWSEEVDKVLYGDE